MNKELIIRSNSSSIDFALLIDGDLTELHRDKKSKQSLVVGDIMFVKIRKPASGLNAFFVSVGYKKDGFLHYSNLGKQIRTSLEFVKALTSGKKKDFSIKNFPYKESIEKEGKIEDVIKANQCLLVQIIKEPISTKGPRLSAEISVAGRYCVLVPFSDKVSVSQKILDKKERSRLERLVKSIKPKNFGVIVRTVAKNKKVADLDADLRSTYDLWEQMCITLKKSTPPATVLSELDKASSIIRDMFDDKFTGMHVDNESLFNQIKEGISKIAPDKENIVKYYESSIPIFEKFGIERQIKSLFGRVVPMSKGAYLVIEHTEALHVIDVNSGGRSNKLNTQQDTALEVNLIAAKEIAKQLRLRDMGGIIVVDFIDMDKAEDRGNLYTFLKENMNSDKARHKVLPPSKFGLVQITRQRVRPEKNINTQEKSPDGEGVVSAPILLIDKIEFEFQQIIQNNAHKNGLILNIHPFIAAYICSGFLSIRLKWSLKYKVNLKVIPRDAYKYLEYKFKDKESNELSLNNQT